MKFSAILAAGFVATVAATAVPGKDFDKGKFHPKPVTVTKTVTDWKVIYSFTFWTCKF